MRAISLFSGAGGFDLGFQEAGLLPCISIDNDPTCRAVLRANFESVVPELGDVRCWTGRMIRDEAGIGASEIDVLFGGPPCQPFSIAGFWYSGETGRLADERSSTLVDMLRIAEELLPRAVVIENVPGFSFRGKAEGMALVERAFRRINRRHGTKYRPVSRILDSADFGVPQHRRRLFVVAFRDGRRFEFPRQTHGEGLRDYLTCWDAIGDIKVPQGDLRGLQVSGKWADLLPTIPEGENYLWHTARGGGVPIFGWRTRYWNFLLKLRKDRPSWTISANPGSAAGPFHWDNRRLSRAELMAIQTFPRDFRLDCDYASAQRLVGNSVAPLLAEVIGRALVCALRPEFELRSEEPALSVQVAKSKAPEAFVIEEVPDQFKVVAPPADHPGEGAGPGALRRAAANRA